MREVKVNRIPVVVRSIAGIVRSNPAEGMVVRLLCWLLRADHSFRGFLPRARARVCVCTCVCVRVCVGVCVCVSNCV